EEWIDELCEIEGVELMEWGEVGEEYEIDGMFDEKGEEGGDVGLREVFCGGVGRKVGGELIGWEGGGFKVGGIDCDD
ncbi:hypothetical protein, partial [Bacillus pumilus]|uniref:hypothetical protein n=1 Tax=Bacillus pumilus TaxID=1408 RepID=UPI0016427489